MTLNLTNFGPFLKTLWPQQRVRTLTYKNHPFLAMVPKDENFGGEAAVITVQHSDTQGRSATFATAKANKGNLGSSKFTITRVKDYALASVDGETIEASKGDNGALARAWDRETKSAMQNISRSLAIDLFRSGTGARGVRGSVSGNVLTLATTADVHNFEVGQKLVASASDGGALRAGTSAEISAIDYSAGTITSTQWANITSFADNDYLYVEGDAAAGSTNKKVTGLAGWLPATAPGGSDSFFGVNRSINPDRLAGRRFNISTMAPDEGLNHAVDGLHRVGGDPDFCFVPYDFYTNIKHALGSKVEYDDLEVGGIGFRTLLVHGPTSNIRVIPDVNCPKGYGYLLQMDTWKLRSIGMAPRILNLDGLNMLRESDADAYEVRIGYYAQLTCDGPGNNAVLTLPA